MMLKVASLLIFPLADLDGKLPFLLNVNKHQENNSGTQRLSMDYFINIICIYEKTSNSLTLNNSSQSSKSRGFTPAKIS